MEETGILSSFFQHVDTPCLPKWKLLIAACFILTDGTKEEVQCLVLKLRYGIEEIPLRTVNDKNESADGPNEVCDLENEGVGSTVTKGIGLPVENDCRMRVS